MRGWKWAEFFANRRENICRQRFAREQREAAFRSTSSAIILASGTVSGIRTSLSIEQKPDCFCSGSDCAPARALNELGNGWNGNVFPAG